MKREKRDALKILPLTELARRLEISAAGVGYSVERGEITARENNYQLFG